MQSRSFTSQFINPNLIHFITFHCDSPLVVTTAGTPPTALMQWTGSRPRDRPPAMPNASRARMCNNCNTL